MSKSISTNISLSPKEHRLLDIKAQLAHVSRSEFIRRQLVFGRTPKIVFPDDKQYLSILARLASLSRSMSQLAKDLHRKQRIQEHLLLVSLNGSKKASGDSAEQLKKSDSFIRKTVAPELNQLAKTFVRLDRYVHRQFRR